MQTKDKTDLQAIAARLRQVLSHAGMSQKDLAGRLGMTASYLSELVRGNKRPGTDFFLGIRRQVGVSIDWLLTGEGAMFSGSGIRQEMFHAIHLQIAITRAAMIEKDPVAQELLKLLGDDRLDAADNESRFRKLLDRIVPADPDLDLVVELYNGHLWESNPIIQRRNLLASAAAHFENQERSNKLNMLRGPTPKRT